MQKKPRIYFVLFLSLILSCAGGRQKKDTLTFVSFAEEVELGEQLAAQTLGKLAMVRNQQVTHYFDSLGKKLGKESDWEGLDYSVYIVNEPDMNHFSLPGGHIFIFRGIIDRAETLNQVAVIIAHEVAHVAHRHGVGRVSEKYAFAFAAQSIIGTNPEIAEQIVSNLYSEGTILDYPEEQEFFADKKAIEYCWKANYNPRGLLTIFDKMMTVQLEKPEWLSLLNLTHPSLSVRYKRANAELQTVPTRASLKNDSAEFQRIKSILEQIPR